MRQVKVDEREMGNREEEDKGEEKRTLKNQAQFVKGETNKELK